MIADSTSGFFLDLRNVFWMGIWKKRTAKTFLHTRTSSVYSADSVDLLTVDFPHKKTLRFSKRTLYLVKTAAVSSIMTVSTGYVLLHPVLASCFVVAKMASGRRTVNCHEILRLSQRRNRLCSFSLCGFLLADTHVNVFAV